LGTIAGGTVFSRISMRLKQKLLNRAKNRTILKLSRLPKKSGKFTSNFSKSLFKLRYNYRNFEKSSNASELADFLIVSFGSG
jgi:hypothetical protein